MREAIQFAINGVMTGSVYAMIALGFTVLWSSMRIVSLAHPSILAVGVAVGVAAAPAGVVVAALAASFAGAVCGVFSYYICIKPLVGRNLLELLIATLGLGYIMQEVLAKIIGPNLQLTPALLPMGAWTVKGYFLPQSSVIVLAIAIVMIAVAVTLSARTRIGLAFRVTSWAPEIGRAYGVNVERVRVFSIALASLYAGLAGLLVSILTGSYSPYLGLTAALPALIAMLIGGAGSPMGAVVGGLLLGVLENVSQISFSGSTSQILEFGVLLVFMVIRPKGILRER